MKLDIVFLGGLFPKELEKEIFRNSIYSFQAAANELQWGIVTGLDANLNSPVKIINSLYIGSWPFRYKKPIIHTNSFSHANDSEDVNVGFLNVYGFADFTRYMILKYHIKKWAKDENGNKVIIAYALSKPFIKALKYIKRIDPSIQTCVIVPDLPQYINTSQNSRLIINLIQKFNVKYIYNNLKAVDSFVLLTKHMKDILNIEANYTVIEGMLSSQPNGVYLGEKTGDIKKILYTGILHARYGIISLLDAFRNIKASNYKLIICGYGDSENEIVQRSNVDKRIVFKGLIQHEDVLELQREATVLINPRQNNEDFTKYSFPSKNMEYLVSGTPVIAYKLDGIPDEYDKYIHYVPNDSIEALSEKIFEICEKTQLELKEFGDNARDFVLSKKNNKAQTKKILELLNNN